MVVPLVEVENLGKKYCSDLSRSLRYGLADIAAELFGRGNGRADLRPGEFWALDGIDFSLVAGECLGVIGPNGAGKSTLVRALHGRLPIDRGRVRVRGRLAALAELGLGFDQVQTGRENVYNAAALLGLSRRETADRLDQILEFAELGDFVEAPVFTYSSGMKARLGYAIAAHLDPDVLLIDEVLAVGDLAFRRKCVQHILASLGRGRALMLVSHDMYTVQNLCTRTLYLEHGRAHFLGPTRDAVASYLESRKIAGDAPAAAARQAAAADRPTSEREPVIILGADLFPEQGTELRCGGPARVVVRYRSHLPRTWIFWGFQIATADLLVQICSAAFPDGYGLEAGDGVLVCRIPRLPLTAGTYALRAAIAEPDGSGLLALFGFDDAPSLFDVRGAREQGGNYELISGDLILLDVEATPGAQSAGSGGGWSGPSSFASPGGSTAASAASSTPHREPLERLLVEALPHRVPLLAHQHVADAGKQLLERRGRGLVACDAPDQREAVLGPQYRAHLPGLGQRERGLEHLAAIAKGLHLRFVGPAELAALIAAGWIVRVLLRDRSEATSLRRQGERLAARLLGPLPQLFDLGGIGPARHLDEDPGDADPGGRDVLGLPALLVVGRDLLLGNAHRFELRLEASGLEALHQHALDRRPIGGIVFEARGARAHGQRPPSDHLVEQRALLLQRLVLARQPSAAPLHLRSQLGCGDRLPVDRCHDRARRRGQRRGSRRRDRLGAGGRARWSRGTGRHHEQRERQRQNGLPVSRAAVWESHIAPLRARIKVVEQGIRAPPLRQADAPVGAAAPGVWCPDDPPEPLVSHRSANRTATQASRTPT